MLIILHGEDTFRSRQKLKEIEKTYEAKHGVNFLIEKLDALEVNFERLKTALETQSLFDSSKFVILENLSETQDIFIEKLSEYVKVNKNIKDQNIFLIIFDETSLAKDKKFSTILKNAYKEQEFKKLPNGEASVWFLKFFREQNILVEKSIIMEVVNLCGIDMWQIYNELLKLYTYKMGREITKEDINLFNIGITEVKIFSTIDSIFQGSKKEAFWNLYTHWASDDAPQVLFSMLERQLKLIALIKEAKDENLSFTHISKKLALHPYVIKKTIKFVDKFSWHKIKDLYARVESLEIKIKTGQINPQLACELLSSAVLV